MYRYIQAAFLVLIISGCSQKVSIRSMEPAEVDRAASYKRISVMDFVNDDIGLSTKIESALSNRVINNKEYFTLIDRKNLYDIIKEQKLQKSRLIEPSSAVTVGNMLGAEAIISGDVIDASVHDTYYYEDRNRCVDKKCKDLFYYGVFCIHREVSISVDIKMIDVEKGDIVYADNISKSDRWSHCKDDTFALISSEAALQELSKKVANNFANKITPHYKYFDVKLLDSMDIKTAVSQKSLDSVIEYIKGSRYDKAQMLLLNLADETDKKSFVVFYNLGVIKEIQGEYVEAKKYYELSDSLTKQRVEEIDEALFRIDELIRKKQKVNQQTR